MKSHSRDAIHFKANLPLLLLAVPHCKIIRQPKVGKIGKKQFADKCRLRIFLRHWYTKPDTSVFSCKSSPGTPAIGTYLYKITYMVTETGCLLLRGVLSGGWRWLLTAGVTCLSPLAMEIKRLYSD